MTQRVLVGCVQIAALALSASTQTAAIRAQSAASAQGSLKEQLEARYPRSDISKKDVCAVSNLETALTVQKAGVSVWPVAEQQFTKKHRTMEDDKEITVCPSLYKNGNLTNDGFWCRAYNRNKPLSLKKGDRVFPLRVYVTKDPPGKRNDSVVFSFLYCSSKQRAQTYLGIVAIEFPSHFFQTASLAEVEGTIAELFTREGEQQAQVGQNPAQPPGGQAPASGCSLEVGQTVEQVVAACGQPVSQSEEDAKLVYFYDQPKLKVTLVNGKVADIE